MIRFPPPLCLRNVILLGGNVHRPDKSHFLRPPKLVLEGVLYGTFSPPQNRTDTFCPPLCEFPNSVNRRTRKGSFFWAHPLPQSRLLVSWPQIRDVGLIPRDPTFGDRSTAMTRDTERQPRDTHQGEAMGSCALHTGEGETS